MLRAIIIDDEEPAIELMHTLLSVYEEIAVVGMYTSPDEALRHVHESKPDVLFLDIEMPERNGLEAAELFGAAYPGIDIVFATAYNQYATDAFELSAIDYMMKPVTQMRLNKTVSRLLARRKTAGESLVPVGWKKEGDAGKAEEGFICFGSFAWKSGNEAEGTVKWRTSKERELFAYLVHNRNIYVQKDKIIEDLWGDVTLEQAKTFLHTCVYTIRKKLDGSGHASALEYKNNSYRLNTSGIACDAEQYERFAGSEPDVTAANIAEAERAASLYKGEYMEGYVWAMDKQEELKLAYLLLMKKIAAHYLSVEKFQTALTFLRLVLQKEPFLDDANEMMLATYARMGDRVSMIKHYEQFAKLLNEELGIEPLESTVRLVDRLIAGGKERG
ncbi:response regulator [Paenibacillus sp. MBLB4367]|uniref:response regulator n=1 Tax=Paenibacillus sp. MBLB4367 TaxID=3384767 RepID=UPI003907F8F3